MQTPSRWTFLRPSGSSRTTGSICLAGGRSTSASWSAGRLWVMATCALAAGWPLLPATAGKAHTHGVGQMSVVLEASQLRVEVELPLDTLVGFERSPRTDAEREAARATVTEVDPSLLEGPVRPAPHGHADASVRLLFECGQVAQLGALELVLFEAFSRLVRLEVQIVTPSGQSKATMRRPDQRLRLPKPVS